MRITDIIDSQPTLGRRVFATLLVRLIMVALVMAVVCWIGWFVPASRNAEPLPAAAALSVERASPVPLDLPAEPAQAKSRQTARSTLDLNQATLEELEQLPGIGPVLAGRIVEYRTISGAFTDVDQVRRVKGIGRKTFERIRAFIAVMPPVSIATRKTA